MRGLLLSTLIAAAGAVSSLSVLHEQRGDLDGTYIRRALVDRDAVIPVRIGLVQQNLDKGYDHVMRIASPSSPDYGQHWTLEQVNAEFAPTDDSVDLVQKWLTSAGVHGARLTSNKGWLAFDAPAHQVEMLLQTQIHEFEDARDGTIRIGCDEYALPEHVAAVVDYITPGVKLSPPVRSRAPRDDRRSRGRPTGPKRGDQHGSTDLSLPDRCKSLPPDLQYCGFNITPPCIRALYDLPFPHFHIPSGALGVFEDGDIYSQDDLDEYFAAFAPYVANDTHPKLVSIDGATAPGPQYSYSNGGESDVDLETIYSILGGVNVTLFQSQNPNDTMTYPPNVTFFDPFLDAIDAAYCDDYEKAQGFQCGGAALTTVLSASYTVPELFNTPYKAQARVCNEFMKLALQGHTVMFSSGDYGVAVSPAFGEAICTNNGCVAQDLNNTANLYNGTIFVPSFPANCPYVLAVGATQLQTNQTVRDPESAMRLPGSGFNDCQDGVTFSSGGGYSNYFPRPPWQDQAVNAYFANHDPGYPFYEGNAVDVSSNATTIGKNGGIYARNGRGIPDVAANGASANYVVTGEDQLLDGTSIATPIWAAIVTLINHERARVGKKPVGFLQPALYENPWIFHDIVNGSNPGCFTNGFSAVPGWDPLTGLGTPDFGKMKELFLSLP